MSAIESLISIDSKGIALIPLQNCQGVCIKLDKGTELGAVKRCTLPDQVQPGEAAISNAVCTDVSTNDDDPECYHKLLKALALPDSKLNTEELNELKSLLREFTDVFALDNLELGCTSIIRHAIDTGDSKSIKQQPYRTPLVRCDTIKQMVDEMQKQGVVQPRLWASPILMVLVPKKDGSLRFCVDFRKLNSVTRKDVYPLPRVDDIFDTLNGARYFSLLDLASGYWQVKLDKDAQAKSVFSTYNGLYEFIRMPFGLCNAPATFQRVMQAVLAGLEWQSCFVYLDDILIALRTFSEHLQHIREVL